MFGKRWLWLGIVTALALSGALLPTATASSGPSADRHVLLLSVDGLHASDLALWISDHPDSNLAHLANRGTTYANAFASQPSDSFPGLLAMVTGGTPRSTGVYYDDAWARDLSDPKVGCSVKGTEAAYAENLDTTVDGLIRIDAGIDSTLLPVGGPKCSPVPPHDYLRTNTIFGVAHNAGLYTAWSDKHPAYDLVNGHGSGGTAVNDLYTPEINFNVAPLNPKDPTAAHTVDAHGFALNQDGSRSKLKLPAPTLGVTDSVANTEAYDNIKVDAILNELSGKDHTGGHAAPVPNILGMNFQSVSVGQKLVDPQLSCVRRKNALGCDPNYVPGGYEPGTLAFTPQLSSAMGFVDASIGRMVDGLVTQNLLGSTQIIISAKHGQSPIDPAQVDKIGHAVGTVLGQAPNFIIDDDAALVWLKDQSQGGVSKAVQALTTEPGESTANVDYVLSGAGLVSRFGDPTKDPRTPDLIVQPEVGTIYTTSAAKVAEHGGLTDNDTHVALLVVDGSDDARPVTVTTTVHTTQIAPTLLGYLALNPNQLQAVREEHTPALPPA
jgi:hypothetical protein